MRITSSLGNRATTGDPGILSDCEAFRRVEQSNFDSYQMLRIDEAPAVEIHIIQSNDEAGGIGEPGTSGIAPAVANAIFAATGKRLRKLPIVPEVLRRA